MSLVRAKAQLIGKGGLLLSHSLYIRSLHFLDFGYFLVALDPVSREVISS